MFKYKHMVCLFYNFSRTLYLKKIPILPQIIKYAIRVIFSADIPYTAKIHKEVDFMHNGLGVVIHARATIGKNSVIYQNVTIGGNGKRKELNGVPVIGENVIVSVGAIILGPISIGDNVIIGAGSLVISDIPSNCTAVGSPARILYKNGEVK